MKRYILNQEEHHRRLSFQEEVIVFLKKQGIATTHAMFSPEKEPDAALRGWGIADPIRTPWFAPWAT